MKVEEMDELKAVDSVAKMVATMAALLACELAGQMAVTKVDKMDAMMDGMV